MRIPFTDVGENRIPGLAGGHDAFRNLKNPFMYGFAPIASLRAGRGVPIYGAGFAGSGKGFMNGIGVSLGGLSTIGGLAMPGAIAGAAATTQMEDVDWKTGAAIGGTAGLLALPAIGAAARGAWWAAPKVGVGMYNTMAKVPSLTAKAISAGTTLAINAPLTSRLPAALTGLASKLVKFDTEATRLGTGKDAVTGKRVPGVKMTGLGKTLLWGSALYSGANKAYDTWKEAHMGEIQPGITRPAPKTPYYMDNAGATGDLVFAMNANRRG